MADLPDWTTSTDIVAQTISELKVDIIAQSIAQLGVNIAAQALDLDIKTSGGANIIIDKLTQSAYKPRADWETRNDNGVATPDAPPSGIGDTTRHYGKFTPRSTVGTLQIVVVYCKGNGVDTLSLGASTTPGGPELWAGTVTPDNDVWNWKYVTSGIFWPYDSLHLYVKGIGANILIGYDSVSPYDMTRSDDNWDTFAAVAGRTYMYAKIRLSSEASVPVSGTITAILLPDETVKHGGLWLKPDQAAKAGEDKNFFEHKAEAAGVYGDTMNLYTVPAGKVLYVVQAGFATLLTSAPVILRLERLKNAAVVELAITGGYRGCHIDFLSPHPIEAGWLLRMFGECKEDVAKTFYWYARGYELDA